MLKKILPLTVLVLFVMLALIGCSGTTTDDGPAPANESGEPGAEEQITLSVWAFEGETEFFDTLTANFEEKYPNIDVEITDLPEGEYTTKIDTALVAGEPPDIGYVYERKWLAAGHFLPMNDTIDAFNINIDDYNPSAAALLCTYNDQTYCIGTYTGAVMLFYNKDIFDAAGVEYPSATVPITMDEYVIMAEQLTKEGDSLENSIWGSDADIPIWWQDARNFFGEEGRMIEGYVNDEATVHSFEKVVELHENGLVIGGISAASLEGVDLLATGQLATSIIDNAIAIPMLENTDFRWGSALVPIEQEGDEPFTAAWTDAYGVFSQSKHPEEALKFIAFLALEGNQLRLENGDVPLNMNLYDEWANENEGRQEAVKVLEASSRTPLFVPGYWDVVDPLWDAFYGDMLEDGRPAQEVLDEYAPDMQDTLDQAWETFESFE